MIIAWENRSPLAEIDKRVPGWEQRLPQVRKWSDVVWIIWKDKAGPDASKLKYIIRTNIATPETQSIIRQAVPTSVNPEDGKFVDPWPGRQFVPGATEFNALLGTPHGKGVVWLLTQRPRDVLDKTIESVTVFSDPDSEYNMLWTLSN